MKIFSEMFNQHSKKSSFGWWMGSYSVILILSIALNLIGYSVSLKIIANEVDKNNKAALKNIRMTIDNYFESVRSDAFSILSSNAVGKIANSNVNNPDRAMWVNVLLSDMSKQNMQQALDSQNTTVIFRDKNLCVQSNLGACDFDTAYSVSFKNTFNTKEAWINSAFSKPGAEFAVNVLPSNNAKVYLINYVPTLHKDIAIMVELSETYIGKLLFSDEKYQEKTFIVSDSGRVIFPNGTDMADLSIEVDRESFQKVINSENCIVNVVKSEGTPFYYVKTVPAKVYFGGIKKVRLAFVVSFLLCVLIVGYIAYIFTKFNTRRHQLLDSELQKHKSYIRNEAFRRILTGDSNNVDEEFIQEYRYMLQNKHYVVALFDIFLYDKEYESQNIDDEYYENLYTYLRSLLEKSLSEFKILSCLIGETYACLISFDESSKLITISDNINEICKKLKCEMNVNICCCISTIFDEFDKIHEAYNQTLEVSGFRFLGDMKTVSLYEDIIKDYSLHHYSVDNEKHIIGLIMLGNYDETVKYIESLFKHAFKNLPINMLRIFMTDLINILLKAMSKIDTNSSLNIAPLYETFPLLENVSKMYEVKSIIFDFVKKLCDIRCESKSESDEKNKKYQEIARYIEENYSNPALDVNMLAREFNMNRSWLSTKFHEKTGVGLSEYIIKCRINKAKELLKTDMNVNEIAQEVGFSSKVVYCRAFKKYENITSMQYRKIILENSDNAENTED